MMLLTVYVYALVSVVRVGCVVFCVCSCVCALVCCALVCCAVLYCTVLLCAMLCCAVLCCAVLCCAVCVCVRAVSQVKLARLLGGDIRLGAPGENVSRVQTRPDQTRPVRPDQSSRAPASHPASCYPSISVVEGLSV